MGDQSQSQDRSFQSMMNPNSFNMNQGFPQQMMNLDNSMMSAGGGNNQATSQMFDMVNNMFKMMMMNQNGGQFNPNALQSMMSQYTNNMNSSNMGGMNANNVNSQLMGVNQFQNNIQPQQYQQQQQQSQLKQNSNINLNNTMTRENIDTAFRSMEDRFFNQQNDLQNFYDKLQKPNQSPIGINKNQQIYNNQNLNLINKKNNNPQITGNNSSNLFDLSGFSDQQLQSKSEFVEYDNNFDQSQNFNNFQSSNKQSFAGNQNPRGQAGQNKEEDNDLFHKSYNQKGVIQAGNGRNEDIMHNNQNQDRNLGNMHNDRKTNNLNNEKPVNQGNLRNSQMPNKFEEKSYNVENVNSSSVMGDDNEFLRDSILNMHQHQGQNQYSRNQQNFNKMNNYESEYQQKEKLNQKQFNSNSLSDNDQQYLMSNQKVRGNNLINDESRFNRGQIDNIHPPLSTKSQYQNRPYDNNQEEEINQYLPIQSKNSRQTFADDERPIKGAKNQNNQYQDQFEQQVDSLPSQKQAQNKNIQIQNKMNNYQEVDQPIKSQNKNYFNDERPIQTQKNNQNKNFVDDEDETPIQAAKNQLKKNQMGNESDLNQQNFNTSRCFNPIEEIPIKSKAGFRRFEDLIEEKMREEGQEDFQDYNDYNKGQGGSKRQSFLKKGSRTFLSNAQKRSKAAQNHIEEIGNQQKGDVIGGSASVTNIQKPKKTTSNNFKSASSLQKNEGFSGSTPNNFNEKPVGGSSKLNQIHSTGGLDSLNQISSNVDITGKGNGQKEKKKFLQRGQGKGGGIQGFKKEECANAQSSSQIKDTNEKPPQNSGSSNGNNNQQKKNDKKPQQQKQQKNSDFISLDDEDDYNPRNAKKKRKDSNEDYDNKDEFNDDQEENEFGGKKYQSFKYLQDNQDDDEQENDYGQKFNKNSRPPTSLANNQDKAIRKDSEENKNKINKSEGAYQFDDEEEWGDEDHNRKNNKINNKNKFGRKEDEKKNNKLNIHDSDIGSSKEDENEFRDDKSNNDDEFNDDPDQQYSKVVQKYFNKKGNSQKGSNSNNNNNSQQKGSAGGISLNDLTPEQKRQLIQEFTNEQIEKLDSEVSKVKLENERVKRMRSKYEDLLKSFNKEKEQFAKQKELEIQELEEWKKEEKKKIQNEKRIADRQQKAMQNMPNRKEREEIENLKAINKKLQEEIKIKDQRNKLTIDRQKKLIDELTQKNQELKDEIKHLENMRLDGGAGSNLNKQNNLSRTSSTKIPQKVPTKSPFKSKPSKNLGEDAYQNGMDDDEGLSYSQNNQKNQMKKSNVTGDFQKKKNKQMSSNYDYQYDNNTAKYNNDDDNYKYGYNQDQDDNYNDHNDEDEDEDAQFENYENYQREPSISIASKGSKQGQKNKMHADVSQDYENSYSGKKDEENEDEHLETYEDIINFNPTSHTYSENHKKTKIETKQSVNLKQQHSADVPTSTSNRMNSKSNSISIQNANNSVGSTNTAMSSVSSANKNDKKKLVQNEKHEKENKQQIVNSNNTQQKQQVQQKAQKQQVTQQKQYKYDISTLSQCRNISIRQIGDEIQREQFHYDQNIFYQNAIHNLNNPSQPISENITMDGKIQTFYEDGRQIVQFANGVKRQVFPNGYTLVNFVNQDVKQVLPDHTVIYYFADAQTTQTTLINQINIYNFPSNQIEIHLPSGRKEIIFADGTEKYIYEDGEEKTFFADGSIQTVDVNKVKRIRYKNGKEDIIYPDQNTESAH
ncbi:hypothetical protein ABPG72_013649 [Tetrahymena utriculariae]